ncbi:MAG TPA: transposase [Gammaproteobacteria bacterium]|nr:transposase [Gammaproteobacteria bacterium]
MARRPRISPAGWALHVVQRGNNRMATFLEERDYREYLRLLEIAAKRWKTAVHAYVLMTNHVHLLVTPESESGVSKMVQYVGGRYVAWVNRRRERTGTLWDGRFKSSPIDSDRYCLACYRYIELNPVRAGLVRHPAQYRWSSYRANATGRASTLIDPHPTYTALGDTDAERRSRYRHLFDDALPDEALHRIRKAVRAGMPTGDERFVEEIATRSNRPIRGRRPGRPKKLETRTSPPRPDSTRKLL